MKFTGSVDVHRPIAEVAALFADPTKLIHYQDGFLRKELISGTEGQDGAISMMYYKMGKREMELKETITANNLPDSFEASYEHTHMDNTLKSTFTALSDNSTRYEIEGEYTRMSWVMPRLISILFPSMYRKQAQKWMDNFKVYAEGLDEGAAPK